MSHYLRKINQNKITAKWFSHCNYLRLLGLLYLKSTWSFKQPQVELNV